MAIYVRPKWWLPAIIACVMVAVLGLFIPNSSLGWAAILVAAIAVAVLGFIEYKGRQDAAKTV